MRSHDAMSPLVAELHAVAEAQRTGSPSKFDLCSDLVTRAGAPYSGSGHVAAAGPEEFDHVGHAAAHTRGVVSVKRGGFVQFALLKSYMPIREELLDYITQVEVGWPGGTHGVRHQVFVLDVLVGFERGSRPWENSPMVSTCCMQPFVVAVPGAWGDGDVAVFTGGSREHIFQTCVIAIGARIHLWKSQVVLVYTDGCGAPSRKFGFAFRTDIGRILVVAARGHTEFLMMRKRGHYLGHTFSTYMDDVDLVPWRELTNLPDKVRQVAWVALQLGFAILNEPF